jgi:hypothetical protein
MTLKELITKLQLKTFVEANNLDREIMVGYTSDLLSDVMGGANSGALWVTVQTHPNIIAVAVLKDIAGIIITGNKNPQPETIKLAQKEHITLLGTDKSSFVASGMLYDNGVKRS